MPRKDGTGPNGKGPKKVDQGVPRKDGGGGRNRKSGRGQGRGFKRGNK